MENLPQFSPAAVIILAILIVVVINGGLILAMRRGGSHRQIDMLRRAAKTARNPWSEQEEAMSELRDRVSKLETEEADPAESDG